MGGSNRSQSQMQLFKDVIDECGFIDLGFVGSQFTSQKHFADGHSIWERLDRGLANNEWFLKFSGSKVHHLHSDSSDHSPLWITPHGLDLPLVVKPFRFEEMWLLNSGCSSIVEVVWCSTEEGADVEVMVTNKIKKCGKELSRWNQTHFGNVRQELARKRKELCEAEKVAMGSGCNQRVRSLKQDILELVDKENRLWFQKSKVLWAKFGNRNFKFLHSHASQRKRKNLIHKIQDTHGQWRTDKDEIADCLVHYYQELFSTTNNQFCDLATNSIQRVITVEMNG
ncbi:uncharacterized protein LOC142632200 [Castanea sativa]|uniref:uncharacterized protein LOC142632200 n=1 Tax=Castanea sativa TaxID=21020 RepID=UPI003F649775